VKKDKYVELCGGKSWKPTDFKSGRMGEEKTSVYLRFKNEHRSTRGRLPKALLGKRRPCDEIGWINEGRINNLQCLSIWRNDRTGIKECVERKGDRGKSPGTPRWRECVYGGEDVLARGVSLREKDGGITEGQGVKRKV